MIAKKVSKKSTSKAKGISDLITYIFEKPDSPEERLIYSGSRNFVTEDLQSRRFEMIGLALSEKRSSQPVCHWILSWKDFESPSFEQVEESVDIFLKELGLDKNQTLFAIHGDTENRHVHLIINRVHPETGKVITPNKGFDKIAGAKAIARIEKKQGWQPEKGSLFRENDSGELEMNRNNNTNPKLEHKRSNFNESYSDSDGVISSAKELAFNIFLESSTWAEFQNKLADNGVEFLSKGSGAVFVVNSIQIKASQVDRKMAFKELIKKFGEYEKCDVEVKTFSLISKNVKDLKWLSYIAAKKSFQEEKKAVLQSLYLKCKTDLAELKIKQKVTRISQLSKINKKTKNNFIVLKSIIARQQLEERLNIRYLQKSEINKIKKKYQQFPSFRRWQIQNGILHELSGESPISTKTSSLDVRGFDFKISGSQICYHKICETSTEVKFIDFGKRIEVISHSEKDSIISALQLAQQKWGRVKLTGSIEFINTCIEIAVEHGIIISNPDLKIKYLKEKDIKMSTNKTALENLKTDFEKYSAALGADTYRVTSQMVDKFGDKKTWVLDKENGQSLGFSSDTVLTKIDLMKKLNLRGENIYLTPLSEKYYFILIDDLTKESLERFLKDGFKPSVVLESSIGNYQAIVKIPKNEIDNQIGNRIIRDLNKTYGDPNLSGVIHPHRAPGFCNQKEKYKIEGESPTVKLVYTEIKICERTIQMFNEIKKEIDHKEKDNKKTRLYEKVNQVKSTDPSSAYRAHIENIVENLLKKNDQTSLDWSRLEWMATQRMKVTGFEKDQIFLALSDNGKKLREQYGIATDRSDQEFEIYAIKTVAQLFSERSRNDIEAMLKYKDYFLKVEGRSKSKENIIERTR